MGCLTRRKFLELSGYAAAAAVVTLPAPPASARKIAIRLEKVPACQAVGGATIVKVKGKQILIVRDGETSVRAFDPTCTHQQCTVAWAPEPKLLQCPCHKSAFDLDGNVKGGPATVNLTTYPARLSGERVIIDLGTE